MSLLRVCAYAKCLNRRSLFEKCAARVSLADCCQLCGSVRDGAVRRISETPLQLQRRNVYYIVPKKDHANKRVLEQSQLLDVLEARIQQLQSDTVLDVQRSKVQFVKATSSESKALPGKSPKSKTKKKTDIPKEVSVAAQLTTGRWMKKLYQEKQYSINCIKQAHEKIQIQKKLERAKRVTANTNTEKPDETISTTPEEGLNLSKKIKKRGDAKAARKMEELQDCLTQHVRQLTFSKRPALLLEATNATPKVENTQCIKSYLEVCAVVGDIQRASLFLLGKHKSKRQRIHLTTDVYNIVMRMMAKQANISQIGNLFVMLNEAGLKPNVGSYSAALECMGRCSDCTPEVVTRCLTQMEKDNLCEDDLFNQCVFWQDEKEMVLKALHIVKPHYQPSINASNPGYTSLVEDYYSQRSHWKYSKLDMTHEDLKNRFRRQLNQEKSHAVTIESVEASKPVTKHLADMRNVLATQMAGWQKVLLQALRERKTMLANTDIKPNTSRINLYPHLCVLEDKEYVDIMLESICRLSPAGETLIAMALDLGTRVHNKFMVEQKYHTKKIEKLGKIYSSYTELMAKDTKEYDVLPSELWRKLEAEHSFGPTLYGGETPWPHIVILELGTLLVDLMVKSLKMNSNILNPAGKKKLIPIMYHVYTYRSLRKIGFIKPHPILLQLHHEALNTKLTFDPCLLPMLCPPVPWTSVKAGAYLLSPTLLMRAVDGARQHEELLEQSDDLCPIYDSLNQLGNCPWTINKPILDIIVSIFNDKGNDKLDIPPPLSEAPKIPRFNLHDPTHTAAQKASMKKEVLEARRTYGDMHSQRMSALYTFSIANHLRDEIFWFPHNMDFRGRTYPCPPHLNHLGSDVTRSVLLFAEGRPLGPKGLDWLKIHLVNLTGQKKKSSLEERLKYANDLMDLILDSADKPLNGKKWWTNADEPWQALACCMEIANAVRSPDPTQFISRFPVHQDGSCNGLQHYAALGRDAIGAKSVNLMPSDLPQDVYSGIAQQVERFRLKDAEKGVEIAKALEGFISRKVVKQTVMTVVYGVTRYGGRLQIEKRLKEIDEFPKDHVWDASHYLVRLVFSSLQEMFTGTRKIQDWLTESAWLISKCGHSVQWVTPLGLPVIQPYHKARVQLLQCPMQSVTQEITHDPREKPDTNKQKNAFPPNFIHSLDSTHMMLTSLHCNSAGLTFVSVHDCFWTHALTVDTMNKICREQFVALHSQPILHNLSSFLLEKYGSMYPEEPVKNQQKEQYMRLMLLLAKVPETGDFDLQQVKESVFFFS